MWELYVNTFPNFLNGKLGFLECPKILMSLLFFNFCSVFQHVFRIDFFDILFKATYF